MSVECINPSKVEEGDLVAYLHGDAPPDVVEHVAGCRFCAEQAEQLRMVDVQLLAAFYREDCPAAEVLADFCFNRLSGAEKLRVAAHVRGCAACSEEVASVRPLADEEPPSLLERLREMLALSLVARPVLPTAVPARGEGWQGRFEVEDFVVTLSVQAGELTGRVRRRAALSDTDLSGQAFLVSKGQTTGEDAPQSRIDEAGHFLFVRQTPGSYALLLQIGEQGLALETIQIE